MTCVPNVFQNDIYCDKSVVPTTNVLGNKRNSLIKVELQYILLYPANDTCALIHSKSNE